MSQVTKKLALMATCLLWVWCVHKYTLGMSEQGYQNVFLTQTYEWLLYITLSLACFFLFIVIARNLTQKFVVIMGGLVGATTIALQVSSPIGISTDYYRYIWQGRVSNSGQSNYLLTPWDAGVEKANEELFERMDWRDVRSVYPPLAEQYFRLHAGIFDSGLLKELSFETRLGLSKLPNLLLYILSALLIAKLTRRKLYALVWLLCPLLQFELLNSAHIDALSICLVLSAFYFVRAKHAYSHALTGTLIASAGMVKLSPFVLLLPVACYLYSRYNMKHVAAFIGGYIFVFAMMIPPFLINDFALTKRISFWLSGNEFHGGNPLYEILELITAPGSILKLFVIGVSLYVAIKMLILAKKKDLNYSLMLGYSLILLLIPYIASPIVLSWYWLTPYTIAYVIASRGIINNTRSKYILAVMAVTLPLVQYIDRSASTSSHTRLVVSITSGLILYIVVLLWLAARRSRKHTFKIR